MNLRVKEICKIKGILLKELAEKIGTTDVVLSRTLNNGNPTLETLEKIANALDVNITELFDSTSNDLTALIDYKGELYKATTFDQLKTLIEDLEQNKS